MGAAQKQMNPRTTLAPIQAKYCGNPGIGTDDETQIQFVVTVVVSNFGLELMDCGWKVAGSFVPQLAVECYPE